MEELEGIVEVEDQDVLDAIMSDVILGDAANPGAAEVEEAWAKMKAAAEAAKWPADLSPLVVAADRTYQADKSAGKLDAASMKRNYDAMSSLEKQLRKRAEQAPAGGFLSQKFLGAPVYVWGIGGAAMLALGGDLLMSRKK